MTGAVAEHEARVLRERAAALARQPEPPPAADAVQVLQFACAGHELAIELAWLREVRRLRELAALPMAQPGVLGIVALAGRIVPVLDLAAAIGLPPGAGDPAHLVVLGRERAAFAVAADRLDGIGSVRLSDASRRSAALEERRPDVLRGVTDDARLLLDGGRLLQLHERIWIPAITHHDQPE